MLLADGADNTHCVDRGFMARSALLLLNFVSLKKVYSAFVLPKLIVVLYMPCCILRGPFINVCATLERKRDYGKLRLAFRAESLVDKISACRLLRNKRQG